MNQKMRNTISSIHFPLFHHYLTIFLPFSIYTPLAGQLTRRPVRSWKTRFCFPAASTALIPVGVSSVTLMSFTKSLKRFAGLTACRPIR